MESYFEKYKKDSFAGDKKSLLIFWEEKLKK